MKIINVIPITKGIIKSELSYFTTETEISLGSLVTIPVRNSKTHGIVTEIKEAEEMKAEIKSSPFAIKKVEKIHPQKFFTKEFINSTQILAKWCASNTGSTLNNLIPKKILKNIDKLTINDGSNSAPTIFEKFATQSDEEERFANYKSLIREEFAKKNSVFFCLPTLEDIKNTKTLLEKGIEKYTFAIHNNLKDSELVEIWNTIMTETHPVVIISNGSFLCMPRKDINTIIVERENSRSYKMQTRPYIDIRTFVEILAKERKCKILFGDGLLRTETIWRQKEGELIEFRSFKFRSMSTATQILVDTKKTAPETGDTKKWCVISNELKKLVNDARLASENTFIFGVRKGLYPTTICGDCGTTVLCNNCNAPTVLHTTSGTNFFLCHRCGEKRSAEETCKNCKSWKLVPLGVGVERIEDELKKLFPETEIFRIDKDSTPTHKRVLATLEKFKQTPGSILIGTEMALLYLNDKIDNTAVVSIDPLFSIPDFRINEKIMYILLKMRALARNVSLFQTRNPEDVVINYAIKGNLLDFYKDEIEQRKIFGYPPFSVIVKITLQGEKKAVTEEMEKAVELLKPYECITFPAGVQALKGKYAMNGIIKINRELWPDKIIIDKLLQLPPHFLIKIDPESVL